MKRTPERAARVLERGLREPAPMGLREDAMARLVEARARAGDTESAQRAAAEYERAYPSGRHREEVRRWASGNP